MGSRHTATAAGLTAASGAASGSLVGTLDTVAVGTSIAIAEGWEQETMSVTDTRDAVRASMRRQLRTSLVPAESAAPSVASSSRGPGGSNAVGVALGSVGRCLVDGLHGSGRGLSAIIVVT